MATFAYLLDYPANLIKAPRVLKAQFGDGYSQRAADGINNNLQEWSINCLVPMHVGEAIDAFLDTHGGHTSFKWTPPGITVVEGDYICPTWKVSKRGEDQAHVSATFTEVAEL